MDNVYVIGAAGHVGLPFCVMAAQPKKLRQFNVVGIDLDQGKINQINSTRTIPYMEENSDQIKAPMSKGNLTFTTSFDTLNEADYIVIMIGTPVDEEGNANVKPLLDLTQKVLVSLLTNNDKKYHLILRSTVSPGTTETIRDILETQTRKKEGKDFTLTFCPERVAQGKGLVESTELPQIIGGFDDETTEEVARFFWDLGVDETLVLTPREAELAKLITNMYRYVNFALANEFQMIARSHKADAHRIINVANWHYPRMNMPLPGPNVGGPCLYKDGKFLLDGIPYPEIIRSAFTINEGMPDYIVSQLHPADTKKVLILGASFKAENEDIRNSLSFKLRKLLIKKGAQVDIIDPYAKHKYVKETPDKLISYDTIILMTPHKKFKPWITENLHNLLYDAKIVDLWEFWSETSLMKKEIWEPMEYQSKISYRISNV